MFIGKFAAGFYVKGVFVCEKNIYVGNFDDNKRNGHGRFYFSSGDTYDGEWKNDNYNGLGTEYNPDGSIKRHGMWNNGVLLQEEQLSSQCFGIIKTSDSYVYFGDVVDGKYHGEGKLTYEDNIFVGKFVEGQFCEGVFISHECVYAGQFANFKYNGYGRYYFQDGSMYDGSWVDGEYEVGIFYNSSGNMKAINVYKND